MWLGGPLRRTLPCTPICISSVKWHFIFGATREKSLQRLCTYSSDFFRVYAVRSSFVNCQNRGGVPKQGGGTKIWLRRGHFYCQWNHFLWQNFIVFLCHGGPFYDKLFVCVTTQRGDHFMSTGCHCHVIGMSFQLQWHCISIALEWHFYCIGMTFLLHRNVIFFNWKIIFFNWKVIFWLRRSFFCVERSLLCCKGVTLLLWEVHWLTVTSPLRVNRWLCYGVSCPLRAMEMV